MPPEAEPVAEDWGDCMRIVLVVPSHWAGMFEQGGI
jgi:hypothetical protein